MQARIASVKDLSTSRLWAGVPQMTLEQIRNLDPAYTGHQFFFVTHTPKFFEYDTYGILHKNNLKSIIENALVGFSGPSNMVVNTADQVDGYSDRKISNLTSVTKDIDEISLRLHEFEGLPLKNALEYWVRGIFDVDAKRANYYGKTDVCPFSIKNHSMGILSVQVDPTWTSIQETSWYYNMFPAEVPFDHFNNYTKGENGIIEDMDIRLKANEKTGGPNGNRKINEAAIAYMNKYILANIDKYYNGQEYDPAIPIPTK